MRLLSFLSVLAVLPPAEAAYRAVPCAAALLLGLYTLLLGARHPPERLLRTCIEFTGMLRVRDTKRPWYERCSAWLCRNGAAYHYGRRISPHRLLAVCILLGLTGFLALLQSSLPAGIAAGTLLALLPPLLLPALNRMDNERMLPELRLVYHALATQIRAGVYVTDALAECYGSVREPRLRAALLELAGDIVVKSDLYDALDRFQRRFDNRYVDSLCITVLQAMESGQAVELLTDIGEQVRDMENAVLERKKGKLDRSLTFYQLGMLGAVLAVSLYACVTYLFAAAARF